MPGAISEECKLQQNYKLTQKGLIYSVKVTSAWKKSYINFVEDHMTIFEQI